MKPGEYNLESFQRLREVIKNLLSRDAFAFCAALVYRMPLVEDPTRESIAADGRNIYYNPDWVARGHADDFRTSLAHLVFGCALKHHTRRGNRDPMKWQWASHQVRLPYVRRADLTTEDGGLDMSVEQAYEQAPDFPQMSGGGGAAPDQNPSHDPSGTGEIMDSPALQEQEEQDDAPPENQDQQLEDDGTGDGEDQKDDNQGDGDDQNEGPTEDPVQREEQDWDEALIQSLQYAKNRGTEPQEWRQMVDAAHASELNWRELLRRFMTSYAKTDYSWSRPNRRFIDSGLYLPAMHGESMDEIVFAIDTSGSMHDELLADIWSEIRSAAEDLQPSKVVVLQCDAAVHRVDEYHHSDLPERLEVYGRGGTAFEPLFEHLDEEGLHPAVLVYYSDLYGSFPQEEPPYPTIWITQTTDEEPPFGDVIVLE